MSAIDETEDLTGQTEKRQGAGQTLERPSLIKDYTVSGMRRIAAWRRTAALLSIPTDSHD